MFDKFDKIYEMVEITAPAKEKFQSQGDIGVECQIKKDDGTKSTAVGFRKEFPTGLLQSMPLIKDLKITVVRSLGNEDNPSVSYRLLDWSHQTDEFKEHIY